MRHAFLLLALTLPCPAFAQSAPLSAEISSGLSAGLESAISSGLSASIESGVGSDPRRTMADGYFRGDRNAGALNGGGCAPIQIDIRGVGCQSPEALRNYASDPNRITSYSGNGAFGPANTMQSYSGGGAMELQGGLDPNRKF